MRKRNRTFIGLLVCLAFLLSIPASSSQAQEKTEGTEKLLNEIAGDYEFDYEGQYIVFVFTVEDGILMGSPDGEAAEALNPVDGVEMEFLGYSPDGTEYQFKFLRDDEGKITKCLCTIPAMGLEIEGSRIKG